MGTFIETTFKFSLVSLEIAERITPQLCNGMYVLEASINR